MQSRFSRLQRLQAGHAISSRKFCIAIHEDAPDDPKTILLVHDRDLNNPWRRFDVNKNIYAITALQNNEDNTFIALSDEGDVFYLHENEIVEEKITESDTATALENGLKGMKVINVVNGNLFAAGQSGQIFQKNESGTWQKIEIEDPSSAHGGNFSFVEDLGNSTICCGGMLPPGPWEVPQEIEDAQLRAGQEGDFNKFQELAIKAERLADQEGSRKPSKGALFAGSPEGPLHSVDTPDTEQLTAFMLDQQGKGWLIGTSGFIVYGSPTSGFLNVLQNQHQDKNFTSITTFRDQLVIASDYGLDVLENNDLVSLAPQLTFVKNNRVPTPTRIQGFDDFLLYFDYKQGILQFDGHKWEEIEIPQELLT